ncbi:retrovirus-related pol polyprotein from transposon TNT 1-94 [Tanacetum coccineum]
MVSVLSREPPSHVYRKTSLIKIEVIMELYEGMCCWPDTREVAGEGEGDDEEGDGEGGNEGVRGSVDVYRNMSQGLWERIQLLMQETSLWRTGKGVKGDDPIDAINHMMSFLTAVVTSRYPTTNNQLRNSSNPRQQATINNGRVTLQPIHGRQTSIAAGSSRTYTPGASGNNSRKYKKPVICFKCNARQCGELNNALAEVAVQNSNSSAQLDDLILSVIEQLKTQVVHCSNTNLENKSVNDTLTTELERYKEQVKSKKEPRPQLSLRARGVSNIQKLVLGMKNSYLLWNNSSESKTFEDNMEIKLERKMDDSGTACEQRYCELMDNSISNQSDPSFDQLFELNELKAQSQEKDMVIKKLKERIKSLSGNMDKDKIKQDLEETETINIELDHREKVLVITTLKDELRKLKGKYLANNEVTRHPSDPKINTEPITPKLLNKRSAHSAYIKHTQEEAAVFRDLVDHIKANYPLDPTLESAYKFIIKFPQDDPTAIKVHSDASEPFNGTEFVNQTLREYYEKVGISYETSVSFASPQQNGVVERRNHKLIEDCLHNVDLSKARYSIG